MNIVILGINGKMGKYIYQVLSNRKNVNVLGGIDQSNALTIRVEKDLSDFEDVDVLVDFSVKDISYKVIKEALNSNVKVLSGTTGYDKKQIDELRNLSQQNKVSFIWSPNFSKGAAYMYNLISNVKDDYDMIDIVEIHPPTKLDAPSGTAKEFQQLIKKDKVQYLRLNDVVATHEVIFSSLGEKLTIKHEIFNRNSFLKAFLYAFDKISSDEYICRVGLKDFFNLIK